MTLIQLLMAVPVALLGIALFHDFMAGLGEDRLWGPPFPEETEAAVRVVEAPCAEAPAPVAGVPAAGVLKPAC